MPKVADPKTTFFPAEIDPTECPFREFRDMELSQELWGLGPAALRYVLHSKNVAKPPTDYTWVDDQTQPLPRSVRYYLHGWVRAEELAESRWEADIVVCDDNDSKMNVVDIQVSHAQVLLRSSFCRRVLSICFVLERVDSMVVEHQWENFICNLSPDWRPKYHIYSPGIKPGGGAQHRPVLSKNGCYLVRLFHLGAWRCIWVSDQVPVDAADSPLLPFSPQVPLVLAKPQVQVLPAKQIPPISTGSTPTIHLWPLLICKALLKLFAPDMNADQDWPQDKVADEEITDFDIFHALTGCMTFDYYVSDSESLWKLVNTETPAFSWDGDDETLASTIKSKGPKKPTAKDTGPSRRSAFVCVTIEDTQHYPAYALPGFSPGQEMTLLVTLTRDVPIRKPLPEPDVALWKYYRWVDWAKRHGLYESFECPRTRYFKVNALMKLSYAPHLLDLQSTESITFQFRTEHTKTAPAAQKDDKKKKDPNASPSELFRGKEEYKDWILVDAICKLVKEVKVAYYPSLFQYTSASNNPPIRQYKNPPNRAIDMIAPKCSPLYLQLDNSEENVLKISIAVLHPRIMLNCGVPLMDYIEPSYLFLERFKWFEDREIPVAETFLMTRIYNTVQVSFEPGRHFFRVWVHSRMNWHIMLMSESNVLLGTRDLIQSAAALECPWVDRYLNNLGMSFINWIRVNRSNPLVNIIDKELFTSYQPDLTWDPDVVGYKQCYIHWMFRQALQSLLKKNLSVVEFRAVSVFLRHYFSDPDFGLPPKPEPPKSLREIVEADPCDCEIPVAEEVESVEEEIDEQREEEKTDLIDADTMNQLLTMPKLPVVSQICELATEEVPCGILKEEREKMIRKHEAATVIQSFWRGYWARQCLQESVLASSDDFKLLMDFAFGNHESLRNLMNEFFGLFPGTKSAYSIASGLTGVYGSLHFTGTTPVTPSCKWIPFFQGVFFCHAPVKVHFDIHSSIHNTTFAVFNNDTGCQMPQAFNAHVTFDFQPNTNGYTVMGHGSLNNPSGINYEAYWQLTVLTSIIGVFHVCNNELDACTEIPIQTCYKLHVDEMFLPNRRNILGGIIVAVSKNEAVSFRAATTCPGLELLATLRTTVNGEMRELGSCAGTGELYWPYIKLKATTDLLLKKKSTSHANLSYRDSNASSTRSVRSTKGQKPISAKAKTSAMKIKDSKPAPPEPKQYSILVTAPTGWPLNLEQWTRVDEVRNSIEMKMDAPAKKPTGKQPTSAKEKDKEKAVPLYIPVPGDAYTELECSLASNGGAAARRDDDMDVQFYTARKAWDAKEPGRNARGAQIRKEFRTEYLEALAVPPPTAVDAVDEEPVGEFFGEEEKVPEEPAQQGPTPVSESGMLEMEVEVEEEMKYLLMPDQLRDKFIQLQFLALCMKDKLDQASVLVTPDIAEAAKQDRFARIEAAIERMNELQHHNEEYVIKAQRRRGHLLETLFVESQWSQELIDVLEERDDAIVRETLLRSMSALRKKQEQKQQGKK